MRENRVGKRWLLWLFLAGAVVPLGLTAIGWIARSSNAGATPRGHTSITQWAFLWIIWPTWILMLDADHAPTAAFMLVLAALLNGLWYGAVGLLAWQVSAQVKRFWGTGSGHSQAQR